MFHVKGGGGGGRKKSQIGHKDKDETTVVDLNSHISDANGSDSSKSETEEGRGGKVGGVSNVI